MIRSFPVVPSCVPRPVPSRDPGISLLFPVFRLQCRRIYEFFIAERNIKIDPERRNSGNKAANQRVGRGTQWEQGWNRHRQLSDACGPQK